MIPLDNKRGAPPLAAEAGSDASLVPRSSDRAPFVLLLSEIERELRLQGQWDTAPPSARAFGSRLPFCCDSMRFTQWLQWVFVPRTRALVEAGGPMPRVSGIRPMAEEALQGCAWSTASLIVLLERFDRLIVRNSG